MGDTVLTTPLMNTLKQNFKDCNVDIILNDKIAPLLYHHPSVDNIITFTEKERHNLPVYIAKVWRIMRAKHYDAIFDMRSNINTLLFQFMAPGTLIRSGIDTGYSKLIQTNSIKRCRRDEQMIDHNLKLLAPLEKFKQIKYDRRMTLAVAEDERLSFKAYMEKCGIDFSRPIMLAGVTAKLENKTWNKEYTIDVLKRFINEFNDVQIVLNYAPGKEEEDAKEISKNLDSKNVFLNISAKGLRELIAMAHNVDFYFGNEGGARHIVDASGKPTFSICSPGASKQTWIPAHNVHHQAIAPSDFATPEQLSTMTHEQKYELIKPDYVWEKLKTFTQNVVINTMHP